MEFPFKQDGLFVTQLRDKEKTLPDGSQITVGTDKKEKIVVYCKRSEYSPAKVYVQNYNTGDITVDGKKGTGEDEQEMMKLIAYLKDNSKVSDLETIIFPNKEEGV